MSYKLYDYVDNRGNNTIKDWILNLQKPERGRLDLKLALLEKHGLNLGTGLLTESKLSHIKEIKINGRVALRLMVCKGPIENDKEFTLLFGAIEKDRKLIPNDAVQRAEIRRQEIIANPSSRRCLHEWIA